MDQNMEMVDRISQLPEPIMHRILSFLPIKEVIRTQVLSKAWNHVWNTFPILEFNRAFIKEIFPKRVYRSAREWHTLLRKRDGFLNFVEQILLSRCRQMLSINKFTLHMPYCDSNMVPQIDRCIAYVVQRNVKELDIAIKMRDRKRYKVPKIVFDHFGAELPNVSYSSLTRLCLSGVYVDDHAVQNLSNSSPGIEDLSFSVCGGLKSLQVSGLLQLKKVNVKSCFELERVEIEAPNLQYFKYDKYHHRYRYNRMLIVLCEINIVSCKNMKTLILYGASMTEKSFHDHISAFPFLENLELHKCNRLKHIKISSHCLRELILTQCQNLVEAKIDAPYLCSFKYWGNDKDYSIPDCTRYKFPKIVFDHFGAELPNVRYSSLKRLFLSGVYVDDHAVQNLLNNCPGIEDFNFNFCGGFKILQVSSFLQLKKVNVKSCVDLERVDIEAPNLQYFNCHYYNNYDSKHVRAEINITSCKNLKTLILYGANMTEKLFHDHISVFPLLENLELCECNMLEHIKISSRCLKELILTRCQKLVEAKIDAPYLCSFNYWGSMVPLSMNAVALFRAELRIHCKVCFVKLMEFLEQFNCAKELILHYQLENIIIPKESRPSLIPPPFSANHLTLRTCYYTPHAIVEFVDSMLWMFSHLDSLSIESEVYSEENIYFKFVYEKQLDREENLCWQHCLKEVKIEGTEDEWRLTTENVWNLKKYFFENAKNLEKVDVN